MSLVGNYAKRKPLQDDNLQILRTQVFRFHSQSKLNNLNAAFQFPATPKGRLEGNRKVRQLDGNSSARRRAGG